MTFEVSQDPSDTDDVGELQVAEYLVFLLSLETYLRWLEEEQSHDTTHESDDPHQDEDGPDLDPVAKNGMRLMARIDSQMSEAVTTFVTGQLPTEAQKKMFARGMGRSARSPSGVIYRAYQVQQCLERGGAPTLRAVFDTNRAIKIVKSVMALSDNEPATTAIPEFASYPMANALIRKWLDDAAEAVVKATPQGSKPLKVKARTIDRALAETSGSVEKLRATQMTQLGTTTGSEVLTANKDRQDQLDDIESRATAAAKRSLELAGDSDEPLTRSQVVGVATAAALAANTDPQDMTNVPATLRAALGRDDEQMAAALTDGRVVVSAGAGSGKSRTAVARVEYLIKDRGVPPSRILVTSFNREAADGLTHRISQSISPEAMAQLKENVDTMHSIFRRKIIEEYGSEVDKARVSRKALEVQGGVSRLVNSLWRKENREVDPDTGKSKEGKAPRLSSVGSFRSKWKGSGITPAQARMEASSAEELDAAQWYEMYEGLKGNIPGWRFTGTDPLARAAYEQFMDKQRPGGRRLADFDDWLEIARDILRNDKAARKALQGSLDHVIVDECQDLNPIQAEVFDLMTEHLQEGDGKSYWQVGDVNQCVYTFRGAKPELFAEKAHNPLWKNRQISTNYRCPPAHVRAANQLISNNPRETDLVAKPAPHKSASEGSMVFARANDEVAAARLVIEQVLERTHARAEVGKDPEYQEHAVLARTRSELDAYETALILRGIPYARKGAKASFGTPEMKGALGALQVINEQDSAKSVDALLNALQQPYKGLKIDRAGLQRAFAAYARRKRGASNTILASYAVDDNAFLEILSSEISQDSSGGWKDRKVRERLDRMVEDFQGLREVMSDTSAQMTDVMEVIMGFRGIDLEPDPARFGKLIEVTKTFRDMIRENQEDKSSDEDEADDEADEDKAKDMGGLSFMYDLMVPNADDPHDAVSDPRKLDGFMQKVSRIQERAKELSVDLNVWKKAQSTLPVDQRHPPAAVYLGTVHSTKGAQWDNTYVLMPANKFPMKLRAPKGLTPEQQVQFEESPAAQKQLADERRLAYVAVTRAQKSMTVVCPDTTSNGGKGGVSSFVGEMGLRLGENIGAAEEALAEMDGDQAALSPVVQTTEGPAIKVAGWDYNEGEEA